MVEAVQWNQRQGLLQFEPQSAASGGLPGSGAGLWTSGAIGRAIFLSGLKIEQGVAVHARLVRCIQPVTPCIQPATPCVSSLRPHAYPACNPVYPGARAGGAGDGGRPPPGVAAHTDVAAGLVGLWLWRQRAQLAAAAGPVGAARWKQARVHRAVPPAVARAAAAPALKRRRVPRGRRQGLRLPAGRRAAAADRCPHLRVPGAHLLRGDELVRPDEPRARLPGAARLWRQLSRPQAAAPAQARAARPCQGALPRGLPHGRCARACAAARGGARAPAERRRRRRPAGRGRRGERGGAPPEAGGGHRGDGGAAAAAGGLVARRTTRGRAAAPQRARSGGTGGGSLWRARPRPARARPRGGGGAAAVRGHHRRRARRGGAGALPDALARAAPLRIQPGRHPRGRGPAGARGHGGLLALQPGLVA
eukprot:scaffold11090_cov40-Phaeocystis_antarctica.AAC.4